MTKTGADTANTDYSVFRNFTPEEKVEVLFRELYAPLCKSLYNLLRDSSAAEDIVQEVFLKIWDRRDKLQIDQGIKSYLYRSCYNSALNFLKLQKKISGDDVAGMDIMGYMDTEKNMLFREAESSVYKAIDSLPPKTKIVFSLSRFEELSYKEIADRLEVSVKAVEKHMGIALQRLKNSLKDVVAALIISLISQIL
ncbi:RNA polymerase sigma-70 factor [Cytophagaceae bacterium ABcell3]|nr:RNA polymerase sigma-70 factor [Cytophagaceae bacterium ABcell3]